MSGSTTSSTSATSPSVHGSSIPAAAGPPKPVRGQDYLQSNLKLFDYLGRLGLYAIFVHCHLSVDKELDGGGVEKKEGATIPWCVQ